MDFRENCALRKRRRRVWLAGALRAQPFCRARQRHGESPLDKNQREPRDQNGLDECREQGIAKRAGNLSVDVTCVVEDSQRARNFTIAVKRQRINMNRPIRIFGDGRSLLRIQKFTYAGALLQGVSCSRWAHLEGRRETGSYRQRSSSRVVYSDAFQVFALSETLDEMLQVLLRRRLEQRLDAFLKTFAENFRPAREVIAQIALLRPHLVRREK